MKLFPLSISSLIGIFLTCNVYGQDFSAKVENIIDGDTLEVSLNNGKRNIYRLAFIDAPELDQSYGKRSKRNLEKHILGQQVLIIPFKEDIYGRNTAIVKFKQLNINFQQVKDGYAWSLSPKSINPTFFKAELNAQKYKKGLWNEDAPIAPWNFRN